MEHEIRRTIQVLRRCVLPFQLTAEAEHINVLFLAGELLSNIFSIQQLKFQVFVVWYEIFKWNTKFNMYACSKFDDILQLQWYQSQ